MSWYRTGSLIKLKNGETLTVTESDQFTTTGFKHNPDALVNELEAVDNEEVEEVLVQGGPVFRRGRWSPTDCRG